MYIYGKHPNEGNAETSQEEIEKTHTHGRKGSRGEMAMKRLVKVITIIAFMFLVIGGSALDSRNILIPIAMIVPALVWFCLLAWANREGRSIRGSNGDYRRRRRQSAIQADAGRKTDVAV